MDLVKALGLVLVVGAVVWLVMALIDALTGREVAELFLHGGHWHAVTSRGPVLVSELLKSGYVRVGVK